MQWIITADLIQTGKVGLACAPRDWIKQRKAVDSTQRKAMNQAFAGRMNFEFRLYDDDNHLYYEGACLDLDQQDADHAFLPLDWAEGEAGCTRMDYRRKGESQWQTL